MFLTASHGKTDGPKRSKTTAALFGAMLLGALSFGQVAQAETASECNGTERTNPSPFNQDYSYGPLQTGDVITAITGQSVVRFGMAPGTELLQGVSYTVRANENGQFAGITISTGGTLKCTRAAAAAPPAAVTPAAAAPVNTAAQSSVTVQSSVTQSAINTNVAGRFGTGAGIAASANGITVSTRGLDTAIADLGEPELNAWAGIEGRRFSGTTTGDSRNLSFGIDRLVTPNLVIGGYVSYNDQTATVGGATTTTKSPLFGAYAASKLNNGLFVSGFVGYGRPQYQTGTTSFTATRSVLGLSVSGQYEAGGLRLTPMASLLASREELPAAGTFAADRLENTQASLSVRAEPLQRFANGILPYATLAAEYRRQGSNLVAYDTFTKPRLGLGLDWQMAAGNLRLDVDYGNITSTANDVGISLLYDFKF